jgi:hypothetical protein
VLGGRPHHCNPNRARVRMSGRGTVRVADGTN